MVGTTQNIANMIEIDKLEICTVDGEVFCYLLQYHFNTADLFEARLVLNCFGS